MNPKGYALITGASSGIGKEFAIQLAARGWSLVLVARSQDKLAHLRGDLMAVHPGIDVHCIAMDLSTPGAPAELFSRTQDAGLEVALLVNNAGFGAFGEFASIDMARQRQMLDLNIAALVELSHAYLGPMYRQRHGAVINIASVAGFVPLPYCAVYSSTKAFVLRFSQALYEEARHHGVRVLVVNPGSTQTSFFEVAGKSPFSNSAQMQTAAQVVVEALHAFDRQRSSVTTGRLNRVGMAVVSLVPAVWVTFLVGVAMRRALKDDR